MYGKKRIGITRGNEIFVGGEGSHQYVGFIKNAVPTPINPNGDGYDVFFCNGVRLGNAKTKTGCKQLMFAAVKLHPDSLVLDDWAIDDKGKLFRK